MTLSWINYDLNAGAGRERVGIGIGIGIRIRSEAGSRAGPQSRAKPLEASWTAAITAGPSSETLNFESFDGCHEFAQDAGLVKGVACVGNDAEIGFGPRGVKVESVLHRANDIVATVNDD